MEAAQIHIAIALIANAILVNASRACHAHAVAIVINRTDLQLVDF
jgi:hypothetical protein